MILIINLFYKCNKLMCDKIKHVHYAYKLSIIKVNIFIFFLFFKFNSLRIIRNMQCVDFVILYFYWIQPVKLCIGLFFHNFLLIIVIAFLLLLIITCYNYNIAVSKNLNILYDNFIFCLIKIFSCIRAYK